MIWRVYISCRVTPFKQVRMGGVIINFPYKNSNGLMFIRKWDFGRLYKKLATKSRHEDSENKVIVQ